MKTPLLLVTIVACSLSQVPLASAQDKDAPTKPATSVQTDANMSQMQANMTKMQAQMNQIQATTDPETRQTLMRSHMQTMQESMTMMGQMKKPMMDGGQRPGMGMGGDKGMADKNMMGGDMMQRHQMMEQRLDMMHMMMEQMLRHQQAMESMPAR
jgi:capsule polysaccharide export protein KpsE/RkpR